MNNDSCLVGIVTVDDIIDVIQETVEIIDIMKPVYNFKASDGMGYYLAGKYISG